MLKMTVRKYSYIRIYNVLVVVAILFLLITIMPFLIYRDLRFPLLKNKYGSEIDLSQSQMSQNNDSVRTRDDINNKKEITLNCQPKTKIGFLKIHKAASR